MAGKYIINFTNPVNGTFNIFPFEVNGIGNTVFRDIFAVTPGLAGFGAFTILNNFQERFVTGFVFSVIGSTGNNGVYTVRTPGAVYSFVNNNTVIPVVQAVPSSVPNGQITYIVESNTTLQLPGRGSINYGENILEDLVHMLEHFAAPFAPNNPVLGQLWYNSATGQLFVWNGAAWVGPSTVFVGPLPPPGPNFDGQLWFDTTVPQLKIYYLAVWKSVADRYVLRSGDTMTGTLTMTGATTDIIHSGRDFTMSAGRSVLLTLSTAFSVNSSTAVIDTTPSGSTVDIKAKTVLTLQGNAATSSSVLIHANNVLGGVAFRVGSTLDSLVIEPTGKLRVVSPVNYETLVTGDNDIPNKKFTDITYVNVTGDTMTGPLAFSPVSTHKITGLADPTAGQDAATKFYVDSTTVSITGDTMTGNLVMGVTDGPTDVGNFFIRRLANPTAGQDAATKNYVDNKFVIRAGDTMTGFLILNADPVVALGAATKQYVDTNFVTFYNNSVLNPFSIVSTGASVTATAANELILVDTTTGVITITLHSRVIPRKRPLTIKHTVGSVNTVNIVVNPADVGPIPTIDGAASLSLPTLYDGITLISDGTNWFIIATS